MIGMRNGLGLSHGKTIFSGGDDDDDVRCIIQGKIKELTAQVSRSCLKLRCSSKMCIRFSLS